MPDYGAQKLSKWLRPLLLGIAFLVPLSAAASGTCPESIPSTPIAALEFAGLDYTQEIVVERELSLKIGMPFRCEDWQRDYTKLLDLDLFADVKASLVEAEEGLKLTLTFTELTQQVLFPTFKSSDINGLMLGGGGAFRSGGQSIGADGARVRGRGGAAPGADGTREGRGEKGEEERRGGSRGFRSRRGAGQVGVGGAKGSGGQGERGGGEAPRRRGRVPRG